MTKQHYEAVARKSPDKLVVITEAGWATESNGYGIPQDNVNDDAQKIYYKALSHWSTSKSILTFVFEAFDEPWKGYDDPREPEKHWGLYTVDRSPKHAMQPIR